MPLAPDFIARGSVSGILIGLKNILVNVSNFAFCVIWSHSITKWGLFSKT